MIRLPHCLGIALALAMFLGLVASAQAAEEVKGKIKKITPDKMEFVLTDKDGKDFEFKVEETAKIQLNDKNIKFEDLKENDEVTVKYDKKGVKFMATTPTIASPDPGGERVRRGRATEKTERN
jgi:hypothetical protein